jgi:hypothetical protein
VTLHDSMVRKRAQGRDNIPTVARFAEVLDFIVPPEFRRSWRR